jgi:transposase
MTELTAYPRDLDGCHRMLAQLQAQCALLQQKTLSLDEEMQRYAELRGVHQQTTAELTKLRAEHELMLVELQLLRRWAFGRRSERQVSEDARQQHLFPLESILPPDTGSPNPETPAAGDAEAEKKSDENQAAVRQKKRADRKVCLEALPQVHHDHDIAEDQKICAVCGSEKKLIGEDISRMLEFVPAQLHVHNHHRKKYGCTCGKCGITMPPLPEKPIEKCIAGPGLISSLIVSKTSDHLPLYRSEDILVRHGLHISRSTQCDWLHSGAMLLLAFAAFMYQRIRSQRFIWTDDTPVMFFDRHGRVLETKKKQKKGETPPEDTSLRRGRFWPYIGGDEAPYVVYDFTISRRRDGPKEMLSGCLCIALRNLAGLPIANAISVNGAVALQHPPPGQRRRQRRLLHRRPGRQSLILRKRMQHRAGHSVIWPPIAVQRSPSSAAAARSVKVTCEEIAIVSQ